MFLRTLIASALAATAMALPTTAAVDDTSVVRFKRDAVLEQRDVELANAHGVDLSQMYKHSVLKHDDGDHVTVWVSRDLVEDEDHQDSEEEDVTTKRALKTNNFNKSVQSDYCAHHTRENHTGPNGPTSGGVQAIFQWARAHKGGRFDFTGPLWRDLIIAGANGGTNALYRAKVTRGSNAHIGTQDVRNDADWTQNRARSFNGVWRASSKGSQICDINNYVSYEIIKTSQNA